MLETFYKLHLSEDEGDLSVRVYSDYLPRQGEEISFEDLDGSTSKDQGKEVEWRGRYIVKKVSHELSPARNEGFLGIAHVYVKKIGTLESITE